MLSAHPSSRPPPGTPADAIESRRAEQALRILADATAILSESLDYEVTLAGVARSLVPRLGEACTIQLVEGERLHTAAVAGVSPQREGAALVAPLKARRETLGVITLSTSQRTYDERGRELVEEIASRAALAIEHARLYRDVEAQRARLRVIADTSRALAAQLDVNGIATAIARVMQGTVVVGLAANDGPLVLRACTSVDRRIARRMRKLVGLEVPAPPGSVAQEMLRRGEPQLLGPEGVERLQPLFASLVKELGVRSVLIAPLVVQGRAVGIMGLFRAGETEALGREDLSLVGEIADRAAVAFEHARLFERQQRATERMRLLADAGTLLAQSLEVDPTLAALARLAVGWFSDACAVDLVEGGRVTSVAVAAADTSLETAWCGAVERYRVESPPPALRSAFENGSRRLIRLVSRATLSDFAVNEEHLEALVRVGLRSIIVVPLIARGGPVGVLSLARTRGPLYDDDDLALAEELGRRAALAVDNANLFKRATEAIAVRDEFMSIASHELNTPLTPLKMQLDSLRRGNFPTDRVAEKLQAASRQVTRLAKLVSELLDVSRISSGRLSIEPDRFDMAELVEEIVARTSEEAQRAGSKVTVLLERPCLGSWDRMRIDQVLTNLLTNAIKYGDGKPVELELLNQGGRLRLIVRDHGIGIAPEHQRRIFERFERAASARHYGGFGLGLWIARQIIEASGGSITVESTPGKGSTFAVDLPTGD